MALWRTRGAQVLAWPPHHNHRGKSIPDFGGSPLSSRPSASKPFLVGGLHSLFKLRALVTAKLPHTVQNRTPFNSDKEWVSWQWMAMGCTAGPKAAAPGPTKPGSSPSRGTRYWANRPALQGPGQKTDSGPPSCKNEQNRYYT